MKERHLSFYYLDGNHVPEHREKVIGYLETKEEDIEKLSLPSVWVNDCRFKEDYKMIEGILKENYGEKGKLTNGFLGICVLFGTKRIKRK